MHPRVQAQVRRCTAVRLLPCAIAGGPRAVDDDISAAAAWSLPYGPTFERRAANFDDPVVVAMLVISRSDHDLAVRECHARRVPPTVPHRRDPCERARGPVKFIRWAEPMPLAVAVIWRNVIAQRSAGKQDVAVWERRLPGTKKIFRHGHV